MGAKRLLTVLFLIFPGFSLSSRVMMQGFYWNTPAGGNWYNQVRFKAAELKNMKKGVGIDRIWFPPPSKGADGNRSMGYDPFDYYDLGNHLQKGSEKTRFGSQEELKAAIAAYKAVGISVIADIVLNHRDGGKLEKNPVTGDNSWTDFSNVKSGMCVWHWDSFHPNHFCKRDNGKFGGFPDICYKSGKSFHDIKIWLNWLKSKYNAGFDGWRFDNVRRYGAWVVARMREQTGNPFCFGDYWTTDPAAVQRWVKKSSAAALDFPLYFALENICNDTRGGGYLPYLVHPGKCFAALDKANAVTFVGTHDQDKIRNNRMLAYGFILTYQGYPCIYWRDYYNRGLASPKGNPNGGIRQLVWVREKLAAGDPVITVLKKDDGDLLVYAAAGRSTAAPGYLVALNDNPSQEKTAWVKTGNRFLRNNTLKPVAWYSAVGRFNQQPDNSWCNSDGDVKLSTPPRGYVVYSSIAE